jgi:SAM-dependent methyltransferase
MVEELVRRLGIESTALLDRGEGDAACRVLYVVDRRGSARPAGTTERGPGSVGMWARVFDGAYSDRLADPTFDTSSWQSRVCGEDFGEEEMRDWVTGAIARIRALGGRDIYEIGCGTGLLLWRLIDGCDHYLGSDISSVAVKRLRRELEQRGVEHARIDQREATDIADLRAGGVDTVVINSVTQYFPSQEYLRRVLDGTLTALRPGGHVFVGDVRNFDLLDALHMSVVESGGQEEPGPRRRQRLKCSVAAERELLLSPAWFVRYAAEHDLEISVTPKTGRFDNELDRFRYDVVLRVPVGKRRPEVELSDWPSDGTGPERVRAALANGHAVGFRAVPHPIVGDLCAAAYATIYGAMARDRPERRSGPAGPRPADFAQAAARTGRGIVLSLAGGHPHGAFDLVIGMDTPFAAPIVSGTRASTYTKPWGAEGYGTGYIAADVMRAMRSLPLPDRPKAVIGVESVGVPLPIPTALDSVDYFAPPRSKAARALAEAWQSALAVEQVGVHDSLPLLGGTARHAGQIAQAMSAQGLAVTPDDLMGGRSIGELLGEDLA